MIRKLGIALIFLPIIAMSVDYISEFSAVDRCLDQSDSFDYVKGICDTLENHQYISYIERHLSIILCGVAISLLGVFFWRCKKKY